VSFTVKSFLEFLILREGSHHVMKIIKLPIERVPHRKELSELTHGSKPSRNQTLQPQLSFQMTTVSVNVFSVTA
jgi:hypothetical protein